MSRPIQHPLDRTNGEVQMQDEDKYNTIVHKAHCQTYNFVCRAKKDSYEVRKKIYPVKRNS
jgi:hypothetical protein